LSFTNTGAKFGKFNRRFQSYFKGVDKIQEFDLLYQHLTREKVNASLEVIKDQVLIILRVDCIPFLSCKIVNKILIPKFGIRDLEI
jgi:hypothetical protein